MYNENSNDVYNWNNDVEKKIHYWLTKFEFFTWGFNQNVWIDEKKIKKFWILTKNCSEIKKDPFDLTNSNTAFDIHIWKNFHL